jgi:mono/diheme cytochrome c family protein
MTKLFLSCCCLALVTACHSVRRGEPITGKIDTTNSNAERGRLVFMRNCHQCHPNGEGGLGPALNDKPAPKFLMKTQVRAGLGAMPSFDKERISPEDIDALMDYVMVLRHADRRAMR